VRDDVRHHQRQHRRGQDPPRAADVEVEQPHAAVPGGLREQHARDQETGEDEEDVHADVASPEKREARVIEHDEQHGDGTQALQIVPVRQGRNLAFQATPSGRSPSPRSCSHSARRLPTQRREVHTFVVAEPRAASKGDQDAAPATGAEGRSKGGGGLRANVPADIRNVSFPASMRGYDRGAVEAYVRRVNRVIAELEVTRSPQAAVKHAVERVSEQTKAILEEARESAEQIIGTARAEGDEILAGAKAEAAELVVNASDEADRAHAEAEQLIAGAKAEAEQLIAGAKAEAEGIVGAANAEAAERRRQSDEELASLQEQAEAKIRELEADTATVWKERHELLGDIDRMASRLHEAASAAAARFSDDERDEDAAETAPTAEAAQTAILPPAAPAEDAADQAPARRRSRKS